MGSSSCFCILLTIVLSSSHILSIDGAATDLIRQTCKNTKYYDLCVSSLESDSSSAQTDKKGLALIMLQLGITNTTATRAYLLSEMTNDTEIMKKAVKECVEQYGFAEDAIQNSVREMNREMYDYAYMHVMAAGEYPSGCRYAFRGLAYPAQLAVREDSLKFICDVALGIIDTLGF